MHHGFGKHHQLDFLIGPGKPLDTDKYFIVETDMLGNSAALQDITTGPTNSGLKMRFPHFTIRDSVNVEYKFLKEYLGFDHILAAIGPSVGGMKTYQFGVSYPTYVSGLIPIAATPVTNHQTSTVLRSWMDIIELDSGWYGGNYQTNPLMAYHTMMWNLVPWVYTRQFFTTILKTEEAYDQFIKQWNNWLHLEPRDVRDVYYVLQAWANFNVGDTPGFNGDATAALETVQAQALIIGAKGDMLFGREENIFAENAIPKARYVEIDTPWGHLTCIGFDPDGMQIMSREISEFLSSLAAGAK
jgi:homoserine O-acetyltransferase